MDKAIKFIILHCQNSSHHFNIYTSPVPLFLYFVVILFPVISRFESNPQLSFYVVYPCVLTFYFVPSSNVYGSSEEELKALRLYEGGELRVSEDKNMLPAELDPNGECESEPDRPCFLAGQ